MSPGFRRLRAAVQRSGSARVQRGVTLLELMVTLAIVTIVTTIAVPSFQSVIRNNRAATLSNDLLSALNLARSESVTRGKRVTVCKSNDIADDTPTCVTAASW
ncbi:MAG: GspH/FimT family pseudopilin, partial [Chromatiaceae bacterium]|nr:GspH/FimT family pseudopilin [Chromatiaceae bacterium]